jgi:hypothetical protein
LVLHQLILLDAIHRVGRYIFFFFFISLHRLSSPFFRDMLHLAFFSLTLILRNKVLSSFLITFVIVIQWIDADLHLLAVGHDSYPDDFKCWVKGVGLDVGRNIAVYFLMHLDIL